MTWLRISAGVLFVAGVVVLAVSHSSVGTTLARIGLILLAVWIVLLAAQGVVNRTRRRCPECASLVPARANVCRRCGHRFDS